MHDKFFDFKDYKAEKSGPSRIESEIIVFGEEEFLPDNDLPLNEQDKRRLYAEWKKNAVTHIREMIWRELRTGKTFDSGAREWLQQYLKGFIEHL